MSVCFLSGWGYKANFKQPNALLPLALYFFNLFIYNYSFYTFLPKIKAKDTNIIKIFVKIKNFKNNKNLIFAFIASFTTLLTYIQF